MKYVFDKNGKREATQEEIKLTNEANMLIADSKEKKITFEERIKAIEDILGM